MSDLDAVYAAIHASIDDVNVELPEGQKLEKTRETRLFGDESVLTSLALVSLIVAVEEAVERDLGATITIADERAMSAKQSPFRTVQTLAEYVVTLVGESRHG